MATSKKKIHKLNSLLVKDEKVLAISSHEKDYYLCFKLNSILKIELARQEDFHVRKIKEDIIQNFSLFEFHDEKSGIHYKLLANKSEKGFLSDDLKNIDFFLRISGSIPNDKYSSILLSIQKAEPVITAFELDMSRFKLKQILQ